MRKFCVCFILFVLVTASCFAQTKQQNIRKLVELITPNSMADMFHPMLQQIGINAPRSFYVTFFNNRLNDYYEIVIPLYDKYYTESDIAELIKFYQSPVGRKTLETMGPLMAEAAPLMTRWSERITPVLMDELKKAGYGSW